MKLNRTLVGTAAFAAVSAGALAFASSAAAATTPPWEPTAQAVGTVTFYDSTGNVITSGKTDTAPFAAYAVGSVKPRSADNQTALLFANPDSNSTPANWYLENAGLLTKNPITSGAPASIQSASTTQPVYEGGAGDQTLDGFESDSNIDPTAGYTNVVQVRIVTATGSNQSPKYDDADLSIDPVHHTWTQIYPAAKQATSTTLIASPSPATANQTVQLTSTESPAIAGSVQFTSNGSPIGSPVAVDSSGKAQTSTSFATAGTYALTAVFTPTDTTANSGSTGTASVTVNPPATPTSTSLAVQQDGTAGDSATLTATVTSGGSGVTAGSVAFYDNGSSTPLGTVAGSSATSGGVYTLTLAGGFAAGSHSVVAKFSPTDVTQYQASQSAASTFVTQPKQTGACTDPKSQCTDTQYVQVSVPTGTLVINTPYTQANPLDLGQLALDSTGSQFTASAPFKGIQVTDTRSGVNGANSYTVSALASALSDGKTNTGSTINAQNVGLTNLTSTNGAGFTGSVTTSTNPAASPAVGPNASGNAGLGGTSPHTVFTAANSSGTVTVDGLLTINAPTSTEAGLFTGTITFTVG